MNSISLDEALEIMNQVDSKGNPVPFSITVPTCDINRRKGGELMVYKAAVQCSPKGRKHYREYNDVRNIRAVGNNEIRGIHPILIIEINGRKVAL